MKRLTQFAILAIAIIGMFGMSTSAHADQPADKPAACDNDKAQHNGNKHCDGTSSGSFTECDSITVDGQIDEFELAAHLGNTNYGAALNTIHNAETLAGAKSDSSGTINNNTELRYLNDMIPTPCS